MKKIAITLSALAFAFAGHAAKAADAEAEDLATRMIAVGMFVDQTCPNMKVDKAFLGAAVIKLGVDIERLSKKQGRMNQVGVLTSTWNASPKVACAAAWSLYGADGTILPGMLERE